MASLNAASPVSRVSGKGTEWRSRVRNEKLSRGEERCKKKKKGDGGGGLLLLPKQQLA